MSEKDNFPDVTIRAVCGDQAEIIDLSFNRYGSGGYQVQRLGEAPGQYLFLGELWFASGRWRCSNAEYTQDDIDAMGEALEQAYGIEKARNPRAFVD